MSQVDARFDHLIQAMLTRPPLSERDAGKTAKQSKHQMLPQVLAELEFPKIRL